MAQASENVGCRMLDEFIDDARQARAGSQRLPEQSEGQCLHELVRRIANEMAVPQFNLGEIVERVLGTVGPQIEEHVRKELQEVMERQEQSYNDSFTG